MPFVVALYRQRTCCYSLVDLGAVLWCGVYQNVRCNVGLQRFKIAANVLEKMAGTHKVRDGRVHC
jgi:hypothetical protein